jgi:uncharacterized protein
VAFDIGDEVTAGLGPFVRENEVEADPITAIGSFRSALLGYFDWPAKAYRKIAVDEQVEVLSLIRAVAVADDGPSLLSMPFSAGSTGRWVGAHLLEAHVQPTLEGILVQPQSYLRRCRNPVSGLPLIVLD